LNPSQLSGCPELSWFSSDPPDKSWEYTAIRLIPNLLQFICFFWQYILCNMESICISPHRLHFCWFIHNFFVFKFQSCSHINTFSKCMVFFSQMNVNTPCFIICLSYIYKLEKKICLKPACMITCIAIIPKHNFKNWVKNVTCYIDSCLFMTVCHMCFQHAFNGWILLCFILLWTYLSLKQKVWNLLMHICKILLGSHIIDEFGMGRFFKFSFNSFN
jgi:hypothetical protein